MPPPAPLWLPTDADDGDAVLELDGVNVRYGDAAVAVRDVRLRVVEGRVVAVLGPNGAGKTTLMKSVMGFPPADGATIEARRILFRGRDIRNLDGAGLARLGIRFVPERDKVFRGLSVGEHLRMDLPRNRARRDRALEEVLEIFPALRGVPWSSAAGALSGGERQMLALASALTGNVELLILDEPSLGLAPIAVGQLISAIRRLRARRKVTILLADQNVRIARELADEIYVMTQGTLVDRRPSEEWDQLKLESAYFAVV
jgi:branched-chain amino acid transport system ATP-binding protein